MDETKNSVCSRDSANFFPVDKAEKMVLNFGQIGQKKQTFDDNPNLRNVFIIGCEVHSITDVTTTPDGNAMMPLVDMKKGFLTLVYDKRENVDSLPLLSLNRPLNDGKILSINRKVIDFPKSFVNFSDGGVSVANTNVFLTFYYRELTKEEEKEILR